MCSTLTFHWQCNICINILQRTVVTVRVAVSAYLNCSLPLHSSSNYFRSTFQVPFQRPAIDYSSSTSRIEEVPNYDSSPVSSYRSIFLTRRYTYSSKPKRHSHQQAHYQQFQGNPNQQTHNFMPQVSVQPVASSSYHQQSNSPQQHQWIPENSNSGQSAHYSSYSPQQQPPIMQNRRSSYSHQRPLPYKTTNNTTSQLASALGPQPNASNLVSWHIIYVVDTNWILNFCFSIRGLWLLPLPIMFPQSR